MKLRLSYIDIVEHNYPHIVFDEKVEYYQLKSIEDCSKKTREVLYKNCIGSSDFLGAEVYNDKGFLIGEIAYNGRYIEPQQKEFEL